MRHTKWNILSSQISCNKPREPIKFCNKIKTTGSSAQKEILSQRKYSQEAISVNEAYECLT